MAKSLQRLRALIYKETVQILRDRRTLLLFFALPLVELFLFAYAVSLTVTHLPTAVVDQSLDIRSRDFIHALVNSGNFDVLLVLQNEQQVRQAMDAGAVKVGVIIPPDFERQVMLGKGDVLILLDGSDSFSVQSGYNAALSITQKYSLDLTTEKVQSEGAATVLNALTGQLPITTTTRVLYNPDLTDLIFILPGLIALIMQIIVVTNSAMAIVREREAGTLEQLLATPARPGEMVIAKLIPGMVVAILDMTMILAIGVFWFQVPFKGNFLLLAGLSILFIISGMGLGLVISAVAKTQRQAQQLTSVIQLLAMLLTGFLYPRTTMPLWTQVIGNLIPMTYFVRIIRGIMTKGVGITFLWTDSLTLFIYAAIALAIAAAVSKKRLD
ncbi:MAG: ABC transporter permease [Anaerolineales bacterium]|jgi:ABC-2 type transport system permease protein